MQELEQIIEQAFDNRAQGFDDRTRVEKAVREAIALLDSGDARVAEKKDGDWHVNQWLKKAVLLSFGLAENQVIESGHSRFYDKVPMKYADYSEEQFRNDEVRVVPDAIVRRGAYVAPDVVLMPSFVNIGAYVGSGSMVDGWATVGSCAQVGSGVHLSGGVGLGGVLEPPGARPVIIEDNCFIGSRCIIVEGWEIGEGAVLGANTCLTASTPLIDVRGSEPKRLQGRVPPRSVVIPGTRPKKFPAGEFQIPCALIIGERSESTDEKTSLNDTLREFAL